MKLRTRNLVRAQERVVFPGWVPRFIEHRRTKLNLPLKVDASRFAFIAGKFGRTRVTALCIHRWMLDACVLQFYYLIMQNAILLVPIRAY